MSPEAPVAAAEASGAADDAGAAAFLHVLGQRLRILRARRGMTRRALARQSGISERYIGQMETGGGNGSLLVLRALAAALGVPPAALIEADKPPVRARLDAAVERLSETEAEAALALLAARFERPSPSVRAERIALIGLRGAGKSTLGSGLAARRGARFVELDQEIEREAGMSLAEIFELHGQAGYRRLERAALERVLGGAGPAVIAAGGSIVAEAATFELLLRQCLTVWLRATPEEHMARVVAQGDLRPMQDNARAMADLRAILASREGLYARADRTVDTSGRGVAASLAALQQLVG